MAESTKVKNMRDGIIDILGPGGLSYRIKYEQGTLQLNVPGRSLSVYKDRNRFADDVHGEPSVRANEDQSMTGSFTAYLRDLSDDSYITLPEFIFKSGQFFASWGSTLSGGIDDEAQLVSLKWTVAGQRHGDAADHTALLQWVNLTGSVADGNPNMITTNFESFDLYPTVT